MMITQKRPLIFIVLLVLVSPVFADEIKLTSDHPERYIVKRGDTLWGISGKFLRDPWRWPDVWDFNPQIENPHLIYPGDVITLTYRDGKPVLSVERGGEKQSKLVKLSPKVRTIKVGKAVPTIPISAIKQFLSRPRVISKREKDNSAYIVSSKEDHLVAGTDDIVYVRGIPVGKNTRYAIYRTGKEYRNPGSWRKAVLGYEAIFVGMAQVLRFGDPATLQILESEREALIGDRLYPMLRQDYDPFFLPHAPDNPINGNIIAVIDGVSRVGQYQTIVINLGEFDGIERGHVVAIYKSGNKIKDTVKSSWRSSVTLPDSRSGVAMIFKTFDRVSYALVMKAYRDMTIKDLIRNP